VIKRRQNIEIIISEWPTLDCKPRLLVGYVDQCWMKCIEAI